MEGFWLIAFFVQWIMLLVLIFVVAGILRYLYSVQERWNLAVPAISKYELRQRIEDFELPNVSGEKVRSKDVIKTLGAILVFISTTCSSCTTFLAEVSELAARPHITLARTILIVVIGTSENLRELLKAYPALNNGQIVLLSDEGGAILQTFGVSAVPTGLEVDHEARLINQTFNPHADHWLYKVTKVVPPETPVVQGHIGITVPAALRNT